MRSPSGSVVDEVAAGRHARGSGRSVGFSAFSLAAGLVFGDDHSRIPCFCSGLPRFPCRQWPAPQACAWSCGRQAWLPLVGQVRL